MDTLKQWIDEECSSDTTVNTKLGDAYSAFYKYAAALGQQPPSQVRFKEKLHQRGHVVTRGAKGVRYYNGLRILSIHGNSSNNISRILAAGAPA